MSNITISKPIVNYAIKKADVEQQNTVNAVIEPKALVVEDNVVHMHEALERPEFLVGNTYKVKTPLSDHALYITINDVILNIGTDHEQRRPFEVFINSKSRLCWRLTISIPMVCICAWNRWLDSFNKFSTI